MKKLLKAVALATVMCMLLSTAAFAATVDAGYGSATEPTEEHVIQTVTVLQADPNEQVVLLIVEAGITPANANEGTIMYIDQTQASGEGVATFTNVLVKDVTKKVDIYAGSAGLEAPKCIAADVNVEGVEYITLVQSVETEVFTADDGTKGIAAVLEVSIPGYIVDKMIWALSVVGADGEERRYSKALANPLDGEFVTGDVEVAAAFKLDGEVELADEVKIGAIFLTGEGTPDETEHYTHEALDNGNKEN